MLETGGQSHSRVHYKAHFPVSILLLIKMFCHHICLIDFSVGSEFKKEEGFSLVGSLVPQ